MTMRQLERAVRVHSEAIELEYMRTAQLASFVHGMVVGKSALSPKKIFDRWLGRGLSPSEDFKSRWGRAMELHNARLEREAKNKAK